MMLVCQALRCRKKEFWWKKWVDFFRDELWKKKTRWNPAWKTLQNVWCGISLGSLGFKNQWMLRGQFFWGYQNPVAMDRESIDFNEGNPIIFFPSSTLLQCLGGTRLIFIVLDETPSFWLWNYISEPYTSIVGWIIVISGDPNGTTICI